MHLEYSHSLLGISLTLPRIRLFHTHTHTHTHTPTHTPTRTHTHTHKTHTKHTYLHKIHTPHTQPTLTSSSSLIIIHCLNAFIFNSCTYSFLHPPAVFIPWNC